MTYDGSGGSMHDARVLADKIGRGIHSRISKSKKEDYPYINTMSVIVQPWVQLPDSPFGQATIQPKGGQALYLSSSLVFLFGNQKSSGVSHITATKNGRTISYAVRTKVSILKNHVNGIAFKDGDSIKILRPDFIFFSEEKGEVVADIIDPHGTQLADALAKIRGLASYVETHPKVFRLVEVIAVVGGKMRVLDLTREDVRQRAQQATIAESLYASTIAGDYL
jgi:hypothetical protein